jgi:hypothetical protein
VSLVESILIAAVVALVEMAVRAVVAHRWPSLIRVPA